MRFTPRTSEGETIVVDFGPLSIVVQRTTSHDSRSFVFNYSEVERTAVLDWLYDLALDYEEGFVAEPLVCNAYDASWSLEAEESYGSLWVSLRGITPGNSRQIGFFTSAREIGNLANSLNQGLAYTPNEFQRLTKATATYYDKDLKIIAYCGLGLAGEAGELANKVKKIFRDGTGVPTEIEAVELMDEVGDVLWYCARLLDDLDIPLEDAMKANIRKLHSRAARGVISGSGDNR